MYPSKKIVISRKGIKFYLADNVMDEMKNQCYSNATENEQNEIFTKVEPGILDRVSFLNGHTLFTIKKFRDLGKGG